MSTVASVGALAPAGAQDKLPPLKTGVDGTFAPHAFPKLGGGTQGFNIDVSTRSPSACTATSPSIR